MDTDPYSVTAGEQAALSRRLDVLVGSGERDRVVDLTDRVDAAPDHAIEARLAAIEASLERLAGLEATISRLQDAVIDGFADISSRVAEEVGGALSRMEQANTAVRASFTADLAAVRSDLADALEEVEQHGATAHSVLESVQNEVKAGLNDMSRALSGQLGAIRGVTGTLGGSTDRLVGAGQALLAYLGERDQWLERERDRVLHDVLEEFANGLSGRGRRSLTGRMREVVDRRRDARDAERFRRTQDGATVIEIPSVPPELAVLSEPIQPSEPFSGPDSTDSSFRVVAAKPRATSSAKKPTKPAKPKPKQATSAAAGRSGGRPAG